MEYPFFAYLSRMRYIKRWSLMRNSYEENIQEHSHMTAVLAHGLAVIHNRYFGGGADVGEVALAALYHDASEIVTGDLPTPIKYYNATINDAYKRIEDAARDKLLDMLPPDLRTEYEPMMREPAGIVKEIVKAADKLAAYIKCVEERKAGNGEFAAAEQQTYRGLTELELPALHYFMEHFLSSFELTLDELEARQTK